MLTNALVSPGFIANIGAKFAGPALDFLKIKPGEYAKVSSFGDGINPWLFVATSTTAGQYIQLTGSHEANSAGAAGASTTLATAITLIG